MNARILVVGAGLTGASAARILAEKGCQVRVIDTRSVVGGNAHDALDPNYGRIHTHGPHIFHTNSDKVYQFLTQFQAFTKYEHRVQGQLDDGTLISVPVIKSTLVKIFGSKVVDQIVSHFHPRPQITVAELESSFPTVYEWVVTNVFTNYSERQWGIPISEIDPATLSRVPVRLNDDDRYFTDKYQGLPSVGYTQLIKSMLSHVYIRTDLNTRFKSVLGFDGVIYTGPIDEFFNYAHGHLPYRSLQFSKAEQEPNPEVYAATINFLGKDSAYTRSSNINLLGNVIQPAVPYVLNEQSSSFEDGVNERYYPIRNSASIEQYNKYEDLNKEEALLFAGRLGSFQYLNMDQAVAQGMSKANRLIEILSNRKYF